MKKSKAPQVNSEGKKLLFYYAGMPVYEGDENHQRMERCIKEFGGDLIKMTKYDAKQLSKFLNKKNG